MKVYLVGGAVRDHLLGYPVHERDWVVVGATPDELIKQGYQPVGKDFPVFLHPKSREEYALARTERKTGPGYNGFECYAAPEVTLEQDLRRRDLTINAIAQEPNGPLIDPYDGQKDLRDRVLRHVSPAFTEDPVRILRIARFYARYGHLGFKIAPETNALMQEMVNSGEADNLVAERVWKEMSRALLERDPQKFFEALMECGALQRVMPEIVSGFGLSQNPTLRTEADNNAHTMLALQQACNLSDKIAVRFATLVHNLGGTLIKALCQRLAIPKYEKDLALTVARHHIQCHSAVKLSAEEVVKILEGVDAFRRPERFEEFLLCCLANFRGRPGFEYSPYPGRAFLQTALKVCTEVSTQKLLQQGYQGAELGQQLFHQRILAITALKENAY